MKKETFASIFGGAKTIADFAKILASANADLKTAEHDYNNAKNADERETARKKFAELNDAAKVAAQELRKSEIVFGTNEDKDDLTVVRFMKRKAYTYKKITEDQTGKAVINDKDDALALKDFNSEALEKFGANVTWMYYTCALYKWCACNVLNIIMTDKAAKDLVEKSGIPTECVKLYNDMSKSKMKEIVGVIVAATIGDEYAKKVTSAHIRYIEESRANNNGKKSTVVLKDENGIRGLIVDICADILEIKKIDVKCKGIK